MRSIFRLTLLPLFVASTLMAETLMTIAPTSGPTSGGTEVTITGDFGSGPYTVLFGFDVPATSTRRVDERTLVAVTPEHTPGFTTLFISDSGPYYGISGIDTDLTFGFMDATMNLRVHDVTRAALNYGTEIPIVREREFVNDRIVFAGVPADPRFRNTLRIYGAFPFTALVTVGDREPVRVRLQGATDVFDPAYGVFSAFPPDSGPVRVTIDVELDACGSSYDCGFPPIVPAHVPIWAFITVTNNETQVISTISPQP